MNTKQVKQENSMLTGSPAKTLFLFALPILAGNILQQLYSMVDTVVVGNFVSSDALAAVGNTFALTFMINSVAFGLANGASILIGQYFGAGKNKSIRRFITTSLIYSCVIALVLSVVGLFASSSLVKLLNTPQNIFNDSLTYVRVYLVGLVFVFAFNMISSVFRSLGDSKTPLYFLGVSSVVNIILDLIFVIVFKWGVFGVAFATVIAQGVAFILQMILLNKKLKKDFEPSSHQGIERFIDKKGLRQLTYLALPTTAQELLVSFGMIATQMIVNGFGSDVMAAYTTGDKVGGLVMMPMINVGIALTVFTAQNIGAGYPKRVKQGLKASIGICLLFAAVSGVVVGLFSKDIMAIFVGSSANEVVYAAAGNYFLHAIVAFFLMAILFTTESVLKGAGDVNLFTIIAVAGAVVKVVAALILVPYLGYTGIWIGINIGWATEAFLALWRYLTGKWKTKSVVHD